MNSNEIKILPDGKLERKWQELNTDIIFELHDIEIESTFNLDEDKDEDLKEYQTISGKLTSPFQSLYVNDESKSEKDKTIVLEKFDIDNVDIYIYESSEDTDNVPFQFDEYEGSKYMTVTISTSMMKSILKKIYSSDMTMRLHLNFENSFYDSYSVMIDDVYLNNTKGKVNTIEVYSKSIGKYRNKQDDFENVSNDENRISQEILQNEYNNDGRHQIEMKQMYVNQAVTIISAVIIVVAIVVCNLFC